MKSNGGGMDRILHITMGVVPRGVLAAGLIGWCPPYALFDWNSCGLKNRN